MGSLNVGEPATWRVFMGHKTITLKAGMPLQLNQKKMVEQNKAEVGWPWPD